MRYVAFLFLVLLSIYFLFVKPYLISKKVFYRAEGISFRLSPPSIKVKSFYLYIPFRGRYYFLSLKDLRVLYAGRIELSLKEGIFNSVGEGHRKSAPSTPALYVPELLKESEIRIEKLILNFVGDKSISIIIEGIRLKDRRLGARAEVLTDSFTSHVLLNSAFLGKRAVVVERARVWSDLFDIELMGSLDEKSLRAGFSFRGKVGRIERGAVRVEPVMIEGRGILSYKGLEARFIGITEEVEIRNRLKLKEVRTDSGLKVEFGSSAFLTGRVWNDLTYWDYRLDFFPKRVLEAETESFPVDSHLLRVPYLVFAWVKGRVLYSMDEGRLHLSLSSDDLSVESFRFGKTHLELDYDVKRDKGSLLLSASDPGRLNLKGRFGRGVFEGDIDITNLFVAEGEFSGCVSYRGGLSYEKSLRLEGTGWFRDLDYGSVPIGRGNYRIYLEGDRIDLRYSGEGFSGYARGSLEKGIISITDLADFRKELFATGLEVERGKVELSYTEKGITLGVKVSKGRLSRGETESVFSGNLKIKKGRSLEGNYRFELKDLKVYGREIREAHIEGTIQGNLSKGTYRAADILKGSYTFRIDNKLLRTKGRLKLKGFSLGFSFEGSPDEGNLEWLAEISYLGNPATLSGRGVYRGDRFYMKVDPVVYRSGALKLRFGGLELAGDSERADIDFKGAGLTVLGEPVVKLFQKKGLLSLENSRLEWKGELEGALRGNVRLAYSKGLYLISEGIVDLEKLSFFTATPIGGKAKGKLAYSLLYGGGHLNMELKNAAEVSTYSMYFPFPMEAWIDLRALEGSLAAFVTLWKDEAKLSANVGSLNLRDYYVYLVSKEAPIIYRDDSFTLSLKVNSEGWLEVDDLKDVRLKLDLLLSGEIELRGLRKGRERGSKTFPVKLDVHFRSAKPIKLLLPEGYVYVNLNGRVSGSSTDPKYDVEIELLTGELKYFGRTFFVKGGVIRAVRKKEDESTRMDVILFSPGDDASIFLNVKGDVEDPHLIVWSEPPRSTREILTKLIIGGSAEGIIPVTEALFRRLGYAWDVKSGLAGFLGVEISLSTHTGGQGDLGFGLNIRKKIARAFSVEYQQSTLKDPRATYYGGSVSFPGGVSFYGRVFSDRTSELKLRFIRKFDF